MRLSSFCPAVLANLKLDYCFSDILKTVKNLDVHERHLIMIVCSLLQINPSTSAARRKVILEGRKGENMYASKRESTKF